MHLGIGLTAKMLSLSASQTRSMLFGTCSVLLGTGSDSFACAPEPVHVKNVRHVTISHLVYSTGLAGTLLVLLPKRYALLIGQGSQVRPVRNHKEYPPPFPHFRECTPCLPVTMPLTTHDLLDDLQFDANRQGARKGGRRDPGYQRPPPHPVQAYLLCLSWLEKHHPAWTCGNVIPFHAYTLFARPGLVGLVGTPKSRGFIPLSFSRRLLSIRSCQSSTSLFHAAEAGLANSPSRPSMNEKPNSIDSAGTFLYLLDVYCHAEVAHSDCDAESAVVIER